MIKFYSTSAERNNIHSKNRLVFWTDEGDNWWIDIDPPYPFHDEFWEDVGKSFESAYQYIFGQAKLHDAPDWIFELEPYKFK